VPFINAAAEKDLQIKSHLLFEGLNEGEFCRLHVTLLPSVNLENVQLFITENSAFLMSENVFFFKDLRANDKHSFEATICLSESQVSELFVGELIIMVSFINKQSIARVIKHIEEIPLNNILKENTPQKDGLFKITFSVAQPENFAMIFSGNSDLYSFCKLNDNFNE
jgi:PTHB1 C-terminus